MSFVKRGFGNIFFQESPSDPYGYLTSTGVGDINIPKRPRTIKYDPDIRRSGEFIASEFIRGEPGEITAPFTRPLDTVQNYLQELDCPLNARINYACRGDRNIVWNYELAIALIGAEFEAGNIGQAAVATPDQEDRVMSGGDLKALGWSFVYLLEAVDFTDNVPGTADLCSLVFLPPECGDRCGRRIKLGCEGFIARCASPYFYENQILKTVDCGSNITVTGNDPFGGDKDVTSFVTVETSTGVRGIAAGEAVAGTFGEISYIDLTYQSDFDDAWVDVQVGSVVGQGINALIVAADGAIWAAATGGYIYRSRDIGLTWELMYSGAATTQNLNDIVFVNENLGFAVGNNNVVLGTSNGGDSWTLYTGPAVGVNLSSIAANRDGYLFVTAADATMHRSVDNANSWVQILAPTGGATMPKVRFDSDLSYFGYGIVNYNTGDGALLRSEDGGVSWLEWTTPTNTGLNDFYIADPNLVWVCGNAAFLAKFDRAAT